MSEPVNALLLDDDATESASLADLLNSGTDLLVTTAQPTGEVEETVAKVLDALPDGCPRLLLLDYRLEDDATRQDAVKFRGGTVAGYLRDVEPELPIVLLTSEAKLHAWVDTRPGMKSVFDWTLVKNKISSPGGAGREHEKIVDFAHAWEGARGWPEQSDELWTRIAELMRAPEQYVQPYGELEAEPPRPDVTGDVIHWLLHGALTIPGPLIAKDAVRVTLGVSPEAFATEAVGAWLEDARYQGVLGAFGARWWAAMVRAQLAEACGGSRPLDAADRAAALSEHLSAELDSEACNWCGGQRTLEACLVCGSATDAAHCVRPLTASQPAWADPCVVCYRCVATGRADAEGLRFPPLANDVIDGLREGRVKPQANE